MLFTSLSAPSLPPQRESHRAGHLPAPLLVAHIYIALSWAHDPLLTVLLLVMLLGIVLQRIALLDISCWVYWVSVPPPPLQLVCLPPVHRGLTRLPPSKLPMPGCDWKANVTLPQVPGLLFQK